VSVQLGADTWGARSLAYWSNDFLPAKSDILRIERPKDNFRISLASVSQPLLIEDSPM
jgi:hypothetical protein